MLESAQNVTQPAKLSGIDAVDRYIRIFSGWLCWVSMAGFALMTILTFADVIGSKFFKWPVIGGFEMTEILAIVMIVFALPFTQSVKGHIEVELLVERFPKRVQAIIAVIITIVSSVVFALAAWQMFRYASVVYENNNTTPILFIPLYPFVYFATLCLFVLFLLLFLELIKLIRKLS